MGYAGKHLSPGQCETIARSLLKDMAQHSSGIVGFGARCPMHTETTTSNYSFFYNPESDIAHCRSCGESTDLIGLYCIVNGMDENDPDGFKEFCERYAPEILGKGDGPRQPAAPRKRLDWTPRQEPPVSETWLERAERFVAKRAAILQATPYALEQLARWGITPETAAKLRIGWVEKHKYYWYQNWGLPKQYWDEEQKKPKKMSVHVGLVFPCYSGGRLRRIKCRLDKPIKRPDGSELRYKAIDGGESCYDICGRPDSPFWIVVETERDSKLCWQELRRYGFGAMATGSAALAPDPRAHAILSRCEGVVNALDNDHAGARASWGFGADPERFRWAEAYPHSVRWLVPGVVGKDVGDLPGAGIDVWEWLRRGLPSWMVTACLRHAEKWDRRTEAQRDGAPDATPDASPEAAHEAAPDAQQAVPAWVLLEWPSPNVLPERLRATYADMLSIAAERGVQVRVQGDTVEPVHRPGHAAQYDELDFVRGMLEMQPEVVAMLRDFARAQEVQA